MTNENELTKMVERLNGFGLDENDYHFSVNDRGRVYARLSLMPKYHTFKERLEHLKDFEIFSDNQNNMFVSVSAFTSSTGERLVSYHLVADQHDGICIIIYFTGAEFEMMTAEPDNQVFKRALELHGKYKEIGGVI
jgi:hypothetical protein